MGFTTGGNGGGEGGSASGGNVILDYNDTQEQTGWIEIPDTDGHLSISLNGYSSDDPDIWPLDVRLKSNTGTTTMYRINLYDYTNITNPTSKNIDQSLSSKSKDSVMDLTGITSRDLQTTRMLLVYDVKAMDVGNGVLYHLEITIANYSPSKSQIITRRIS